MRVFLTGATGFIGRALVPRLQRDGHTIVVWARSAGRARNLLGADVEIVEGPAGSPAVATALRGCDAIVNFAGERIVGRRWTAARRRLLELSRVGLTDGLVDAIVASGAAPRVLVSGSAVGFYGSRGEEVLREDSTHGHDFLATLCARWESAATRVESIGTRVVRLRMGVVLGRAGGALAPMLPAFRLGLGGPVASGRQYFPWIHLHDLVNIVATALVDERYRGPINAVAPEEVTSRGFARALGHAVNRPAFFPVPALVLKALFGEGASVLLGSQRVESHELARLGFRWDFPTLPGALDDVVHDRAAAIVPRRDGGAPTAGALYELRTRAIVDAPITETFAFFSRAENLGLLTPAAMKFSIRGAAPAMETGATIDYRLVVGSVPVDWRTRISEWKPGQMFIDVQEIGPYKLWRHQHTFRDQGDRTVMEDRVLYTPPLGLLGRVAHPLFIAPALRHIFQYRSDVIRLRFGTYQEGL